MTVKWTRLTGVTGYSDDPLGKVMGEKLKDQRPRGVCMICGKVYREGPLPASHGYCGKICKHVHLESMGLD